MDTIVSLALPFFGLIFLGFGGGKLFRITDEQMVGLDRFIVYFALPALFFVLVSDIPIKEIANWRFIVATLLTASIMFAFGFGLGLIVTRRNIGESTIQGLAAAYANVGYMAPGLTLAAFGAAAAVPTALIFFFDSVLMFTLAPIGIALAGLDPGRSGSIAGQVVRRLATNPFILATIAGVAASAMELTLPAAIDGLLEILRQAAAPCALFAVGVAIASRPVKRVPVELPLLMILKLIVHPLVMYVMMSLIGNFEPVWVYAAVVIAALPSAANVFVIARQYGVWVNRASATVLYSTIAAVATVSGFLYLVESGVLPPDLFP